MVVPISDEQTGVTVLKASYLLVAEVQCIVVISEGYLI